MAGGGHDTLWDAWAFAAVDSELALDSWRKAATHLKDSAYSAYREALDREERAAHELAVRYRRGTRRRPRR